MKQFVLRIILSVALLLLASPAWADPITVTLTSGSGQFHGLLQSSFGGSSDQGYAVGVTDWCCNVPFMISGPVALATLGGMATRASFSTSTGSCFVQETYMTGDCGMGAPGVSMTTPGVPVDGATHIVPFHIEIDLGTFIVLSPAAPQEYTLLGDGLFTVMENFQEPDGSYHWSGTFAITAPVPEPSTWLLLLTGLLGLVSHQLWARKGRRAA